MRGPVIPSTNNVLSKNWTRLIYCPDAHRSCLPYKSATIQIRWGLSKYWADRESSEYRRQCRLSYRTEKRRRIANVPCLFLRQADSCLPSKQHAASCPGSRYNNHAPASRRQVFRSDKSGYLRRERHAMPGCRFRYRQRKSFATIRRAYSTRCPDAGWWNLSLHGTKSRSPLAQPESS